MISNRFNFYIQFSQLLIGILALGYILYLGQDIILPIVFALILAILVNPIVNRFEANHLSRVVAIILVVLLTFIVVITIVYFISSQLGVVGDALPQLESKFNQIIDQLIQWISEHFHFSARTLNKWVAKVKSENIGDGTGLIRTTIATITDVLVFVFLIPVYMFLFLYYKPLLLEFIARLFPTSQHATVAEVLLQSRKLIQSYLIGLCIEAVIMAGLNSTALLILGIDYALLIGIIGALLNVIPYIGGVTSVLIPMVLALVTKEPIYALWVLVAYSIIQFFDNNFLVPKIVASKVKVNALISIIVVFIGSAIWGVPGMFLSLPLTAIVKVIFDHIEPLKPWGFLIGDTMPSIYGTIFKLRKRKSNL